MVDNLVWWTLKIEANVGYTTYLHFNSLYLDSPSSCRTLEGNLKEGGEITEKGKRRREWEGGVDEEGITREVDREKGGEERRKMEKRE